MTAEPFAHADVTDVRVQTDDGLWLNGWYAISHADHDGPRPLILYFSGAFGHRGYRVSEIEMFAQLGCDVLLVDYRGYGDNPGQPKERHLTRDARVVWTFAINELQVPAEQIVVCGESIGGAVGTRLVAEQCRKGIVPGGLILWSTFACMLDVAAQFCPRVVISSRAITNIFLIDRYPSVRRIRHVTCPILSIHGGQDRMIPVEMGRRLFEAAPMESGGGLPKQLLELPGVGHNNILEESGELVEATIAQFLQQAVRPASIEGTSLLSSNALTQPPS